LRHAHPEGIAPHQPSTRHTLAPPRPDNRGGTGDAGGPSVEWRLVNPAPSCIRCPAADAASLPESDQVEGCYHAKPPCSGQGRSALPRSPARFPRVPPQPTANPHRPVTTTWSRKKLLAKIRAKRRVILEPGWQCRLHRPEPAFWKALRDSPATTRPATLE